MADKTPPRASEDGIVRYVADCDGMKQYGSNEFGRLGNNVAQTIAAASAKVEGNKSASKTDSERKETGHGRQNAPKNKS